MDRKTARGNTAAARSSKQRRQGERGMRAVPKYSSCWPSRRHSIGHGKLRLTFHHAARVADGVKDQLTSGLNLGQRGRGQHGAQIEDRRLHTRRRDWFIHLLLLELRIRFKIAGAIGEEVIGGISGIRKTESICGRVLVLFEVSLFCRIRSNAIARSHWRLPGLYPAFCETMMIAGRSAACHRRRSLVELDAVSKS